MFYKINYVALLGRNNVRITEDDKYSLAIFTIHNQQMHNLHFNNEYYLKKKVLHVSMAKCKISRGNSVIPTLHTSYLDKMNY